MRRKWSTAASLAASGVAVAGLCALVVLAMPRATDQNVRSAYQQLSTATLPVLVLGWIAPDAARVTLTPTGYTLAVHDPDLGDVVVSGARGGQPLPGETTAQRWNVGDDQYAIQTSAKAAAASRVVPLEVARRQIEGSPWDTPLLYLWYLPLVVGALTVATFRVLSVQR
jgi:hypothetical protein